jgi:hypothetical protein
MDLGLKHAVAIGKMTKEQAEKLAKEPKAKTAAAPSPEKTTDKK